MLSRLCKVERLRSHSDLGEGRMEDELGEGLHKKEPGREKRRDSGL